ncbi:uncharacterized protein LOC119735945 [Patiria miniata]|uniref:F-box domain-containing protein n=1 Tax=Patiria miniata TaxID=46514 RepID=A0A914AQ10_PATMI|nr:uncharacterized protein LOC119735945 [Patiria miniata]
MRRCDSERADIWPFSRNQNEELLAARTKPTPRSRGKPRSGSRNSKTVKVEDAVAQFARVAGMEPSEASYYVENIVEVNPPSNSSTPKDNLTIGLRVIVSGDRRGSIQYLGETQFAPGQWAGVALDRAFGQNVGKNDGSVKGVRYFQCERNRGVFTRPDKLSREPPARKAVSACCNFQKWMNVGGGDRVMVSGSKLGTLRYIGTTKFGEGDWAGVELDDELGKNDGIVAGIMYFQCKPKHGLFVPVHKVAKVLRKPPPRSAKRKTVTREKHSSSTSCFSSVGSTASSFTRNMDHGGSVADPGSPPTQEATRRISADVPQNIFATASNEVSANSSEDQCTTVAPSGSSIYCVPDDLLQNIFQHLSASDLCNLASCCRWLRDATNQDSFWLPLCQSRGWELYGTTTDLAKIASYGPSEEATGASEASDCSVTFQNDRIVTDDNTAGLTSTCRWKGVYMRAYHLDRNWATNRSHFKDIAWKELKPYCKVVIDGDLMAICLGQYDIFVYDFRTVTLKCIISGLDDTCKLKDGVVVVAGLDDVVRAYDAETGQELKMPGRCKRGSISPLFFDGELFITCHGGYRADNTRFEVWHIKDGLQHILTDISLNGYPIQHWDYRDGMLVAAHDNSNVVWDARSGECLHKLTCGGRPSVKLGQNVIVCVSLNQDIGMWLLNIWSQDTGECQQVIPLSDFNSPHPLLINNLIIVRDESGQGENLQRSGYPVKVIYDLNGKLVMEEIATKLGRCMLAVCNYQEFRYMYSVTHHRPYATAYLKDGSRKAYIFSATPNGFVRLFALDPEARASTLSLIWMDEIRMIIFDRRKCSLLIHHYW